MTSAPPAIQAPEPETDWPLDPGKPLVLSVEDNLDHQEVLADVLRADGGDFDLLHVRTLDAMADAVAQRNPCLILLDLGLSASRGLTTLERALPVAGAIPIIVLTAQRDSSLGLEAVRRGAADFLDKFSLHHGGLALRIAFAVERTQARQRIERNNAFLRTFVASIGHDLRRPPRQIEACVDAIDATLGHDRGAVADSLAAIRDRTKQLRATLDATLDYARQATVAPCYERLRLSEVLAEVLHGFDPAEAARVALGADVDFLADAHFATLMLSNLVGNGLKYWQDRPSKVRVSGAVGHDGVEIRVEDTGMGMSPFVLERATLPATRGVPPSAFEGTGFGLAIVKLLVEAHAGSLTLASTETVGTTVALTFPHTPCRAPFADPPGPAKPPLLRAFSSDGAGAARSASAETMPGGVAV